MNSIVIKDLKKTYPGFSLKIPEFALPTGMITGLVGENGAGKSTLIKSILHLVHPEEGSVEILGTDCTDGIPSEVSSRIGIVFDELHLPEMLTADDVGDFMKGIYPNWEDETFRRYVKEFHLPGDKKIEGYSKGMKMKLSLATVLSHQAKILILDEPTGGLDPIFREEFLDLLLEFIQEPDHAVLCSTHIISDLEKVADYIAFLHQGELYFMEDKLSLKENYGIYSCSPEEGIEVPEEDIVAVRRENMGWRMLLKRSKFTETLPLDTPEIEDIMLFLIKGERK